MITHIGSIEISRELTLDHVLCVPSFKLNLISLSKLVYESNMSVIFTKQGSLITQDTIPWIKSMSKIGEIESKNGLFHLKIEPEAFCDSKKAFAINKQVLADVASHVWHFRLGHLSLSRLKLISAHSPDVMSKDYEHCNVCYQAKQKKKSFPTSYIKSTNAFELLHCDLWGPYSVKTLQGHTYFLTIVDDYTRTIYVHLLKLKSDTEQAIQSFINMVERQFKATVKVVRSDNGTEFKMSEFLTQRA